MSSLFVIGAIFCHFVLEVSSDCIDINDKLVSEASPFIPGPDPCKLCVCNSETPTVCKAILCTPPTDCHSFVRVGKNCCNFTCLDDDRDDGISDVGLRLLFSIIASLLSLSVLFFVVHRLRQRKSIGRQTRALRAERRGLGNIGYITGGLGYLPENYYPVADGFDRHIEFRYEEVPGHLSLWKPPGNSSTASYFPRGEAPPPYDEVVAHSHTELTITTSSTLPNLSHRTIPLSVTGPGTFRLLRPHAPRTSIQDNGLVTLPRVATHKTSEYPANTLHINISSCGFHSRPTSADEISQVPTPPELQDEAGCLSNPSVAFVQVPTIINTDSVKNEPRAGPSQDRQDSCPSPDDDYKSECENCKSSPCGGPSYYMAEDELEAPETMTLQRLPREAEDEPYYRTSVTLPSHCRKPRSVLGSREGWFSTMPESSSEEE